MVANGKITIDFSGVEEAKVAYDKFRKALIAASACVKQFGEKAEQLQRRRKHIPAKGMVK